MKVALLAPIFIAGVTEKIIDEQMGYIDLTTYIFEDFTEIENNVRKIQQSYDGIVFAGILVLFFRKISWRGNTMGIFPFTWKLSFKCIIPGTIF